jgi:hypothetical protein
VYCRSALANGLAKCRIFKGFSRIVLNEAKANLLLQNLTRWINSTAIPFGIIQQ